jgi:two-component system response regulator RegA
LCVDDDAIFRTRLVRALTSRGYPTIEAPDAETACELVRKHKPQRAIVDLRMPGTNGLDLVRDLVAIDPNILVVVLTGYGSIPTAVEAVRRGALEYLTKPADADEILSVFEREREREREPAHEEKPDTPPTTTPSLARVEWEHIQRVLFDCGGNISEAARRLGIHRRSLQRKLAKMPPFE